MRLLASGRDADVFDLGDGRVLRRHKDGRPATKQADLLRYAAAHGYPVPALHDASGADLVLERLDGPEMQAALRPWNLGRNARILAELHRRLHEIPPMPGLPTRFGEPRSLLHLDLHPRKVLLTSRGPVVIEHPEHRGHDQRPIEGRGLPDHVHERDVGLTGPVRRVRPQSWIGSSTSSSRPQRSRGSRRCYLRSPHGGNATRMSRRPSKRRSTDSSRV